MRVYIYHITKKETKKKNKLSHEHMKNNCNKLRRVCSISALINSVLQLPHYLIFTLDISIKVCKNTINFFSTILSRLYYRILNFNVIRLTSRQVLFLFFWFMFSR